MSGIDDLEAKTPRQDQTESGNEKFHRILHSKTMADAPASPESLANYPGRPVHATEQMQQGLHSASVLGSPESDQAKFESRSAALRKAGKAQTRNT